MKQISRYWMKMVQVLLVFLSLQPALFAHGGEETNKPLPTTIPAIWKAVDTEVSAINEAITNNQLDQIHHHAFAINDLMKSLPALSQTLSPEQLTTLKKEIGYVDALALRLDKTGDAKDKDGTIANFEKLQKILAQIRAHYSAELKAN
jgi:hypothetical protein